MDEDDDYTRLPGLFRLWDLPSVLRADGDYRIHYVEPTLDGTLLFAIYARPVPTALATEGAAQ